ncbi:MAG: hypothetical protein ACTIJ9_16650 [Aequorivita sp.]
MKQKEIVINGKFSPDAEEMIYEYFAVKSVNGIEGFIFSEDVFYNSYRNTYAFEELRSAKYYSVYNVERCDICQKPFNVIIIDRAHLYRYLQTTCKLCHSCKGFHYSLGEIFAMKLDGDIA